MDLIKMLTAMAPFGPKNNRPLFVTYSAEVVGLPRIVGKKHLKFHVKQNGLVFDAISFNRGDDLDYIINNRIIDIVYYLEENRWNNRSSIQLKVKDFK